MQPKSVMMARARWWYESGALLRCPTVDQLWAALGPWAAPRAWRVGLPYRGLVSPPDVLVDALRPSRADQDPGALWLAQLLLPTPHWYDRAQRAPLPEATLETLRRVRNDPLAVATSGPDLRVLLHRAAQLSLSELSWARDHDICQTYPARAWPPAEDHFPTAVHGHRATRAVAGLRPPFLGEDPCNPPPHLRT